MTERNDELMRKYVENDHEIQRLITDIWNRIVRLFILGRNHRISTIWSSSRESMVRCVSLPG